MKTMPNTTSEEKLRWIKPILDKEITIKKMSRISPFNERTLKDWLSKYRRLGLEGLENRSTRPRTQPNELPIRIRETIIDLRKDTNLGAQKIHYKLLKEGIVVHPRTIGKILKREGLVRTYRSRKKKLYFKPVTELLPGEIVEIDIKYVPRRINRARYYQFTAIDCASRWRYLAIHESPSNICAINFLLELKNIAPFEIKAIKTDNGACFTNRYTGYLKSSDPFNPRLHPFDLKLKELGIVHYLIDPGKPAQNGKVERSHRTDQEHFYDRHGFKTIEELRMKLKQWNMYYNDLEHIGLGGLTPNEALIKSLEKVQNVRT
jgi:transposase InsO family protein